MRIAFVVVLVLGIVLASGVVCYFSRSSVSYLHDCRLYLHVEVVSEKSKAIEAVYCEASRSNEGNEEDYLTTLCTPGIRLEPPLFGVYERAFTGTSISVPIPYEAQVFDIGRTRETHPFPHLLIVATYRGGERAGKVVDISNLRDGGKVQVRMP